MTTASAKWTPPPTASVPSCTRYSDGVHEVWDLTTRTMIQTLGNAGPMHPGLAISPDGSRVVGEDNSRAGQTECWSVATGKTLPSIGTALGTERFTFSPDGSLLLRGTTSPAYGPATVFDSKTWKPLCELEEPANGREMTSRFLCRLSRRQNPSRHHRAPLPGGRTSPGVRRNQSLVYDLPTCRHPSKQGPRPATSVGKLPFNVRTLDGKTIPADDFKGPFGRSAVPCADSQAQAAVTSSSAIRPSSSSGRK